jgi:hypothetical protein
VLEASGELGNLTVGFNAMIVQLLESRMRLQDETAFHAEPRADEWLLYRHESTFAGDGMTHSECRVFTRDGAFLASGRSALAVPVLAPGAETAFVVTVPNANEIGRYRVSFRSDDRVIPHVDRRERGPIAHIP